RSRGGPRATDHRVADHGEGDSQSRHRPELHGGIDGGFRPARIGPLRHRRLRSDGLHGFRADPRNRHPHGEGAERQNVLAMIFRRGMLTIGAGLAVGLPIAWGFACLMASLIFGVTANDAATFVSIPLALVAAASLAIYIPARRATKIDPIVALRYE